MTEAKSPRVVGETARFKFRTLEEAKQITRTAGKKEQGKAEGKGFLGEGGHAGPKGKGGLKS